MAGPITNRLLTRFLALGILTLCLAILSHNALNTPLAKGEALSQLSDQTKAPSLATQIQPEAPLTISALRTLSWDGQYLEVAMELVNVSSKPIRAYALKQLEGGTLSRQVMFVSLDASNKSALQPNQLTTVADVVYQASSTKEVQRVVFVVDYVEFSDGTKWGPDSAKSAERSEGQRAAAYLVTKRLLKIRNAGNPNDVMRAIENGEANIEPPSNRSDEWKEGFRLGCKSIEKQLKRAQMRGGLSQLDQELRQFSQRFKGAK